MNRLSKLAIGMGVLGVVTIGASQLMPRPAPPHFKSLTQEENTKLSTVPDITSMLERLSHYEPLDPQTFEKLLKWCCKYADLSAGPKSNENVKRMDSVSFQMSKMVSRLGARVKKHAVNTPETVQDFEGVAEEFHEACQARVFNAHLELSK
jgi:hypothetical protein